jgi:hypothetical protein
MGSVPEPLLRPAGNETSRSRSRSKSRSPSPLRHDGGTFTHIVAESVGKDEKKGRYTAKIVDVENRTEMEDGKGTVVTMYKVEISRGGDSWIIFRRFSQFVELDKKLKKHKLLASSDNTMPPKKLKTFMNDKQTKLLVAERIAALNRYLAHILAMESIQQSEYLFIFLEPLQIGDIKPKK